MNGYILGAALGVTLLVSAVGYFFYKKNEKLKCTNDTLKYIFEGCSRDLRKTTLILQFLHIIHIRY